MTNQIATVLALFIVAILAVDHYFWDSAMLIFLGKVFLDSVEYLIFWR